MLFAMTMFLAQSFFGGAPIDHIRCDAAEGAVVHIHAHVQLFDRGHVVEVPAGIGIPAGENCLYWVHTHAADGIIHIEAPVKRSFTLGEFFDVWGVTLNRSQAVGLVMPKGKLLSIWVNGKPWHGRNPQSIMLRDHEEIVIERTPPYVHPKAGVFP